MNSPYRSFTKSQQWLTLIGEVREQRCHYDLFGLGNVLIYIVGRGDVLLNDLRGRNHNFLSRLSDADLNIIFHNREANQKKVALAEDHKFFRNGLKSMHSTGNDLHVVDEAQNGLEAIRCLKRNKHDLIPLDLSIPRLSGINVMRDIKSQFPEVKILTRKLPNFTT